MDLLYSRYTSPFEFMNLYINRGRFGEFVSGILEMEHKRKEEKAEKEDEDKLWSLYIHSLPDKSFNEWKKELIVSRPEKQSEEYAATGNDSLTKNEIDAMIRNSQDILNNFVPY